MINLDEYRDFVNKQDWIFAKTFADKAPHEYIVRDNINGSDEEFMQIVEYIQENGFTMHWNDGYPNKYVYLDGYNYWMMMWGQNDPTACLNRSVAKDYRISVEWKTARRRRLLAETRKRKEEEKLKNVSDLQGN